MSQQQWNDGGEEVQMPLGTGADAPAAEEYTESRRPKVNTSTLALVAAFAAALVVLYLLGLQNKPRTASAQDKQHDVEVTGRIEAILRDHQKKENVQALFNDTEKLIQVLTNYWNTAAARSADLPSNPFERDVPVVEAPQTTHEVAQGMADDPNKGAIAMGVSQELAGLRLQMVMMGKSPSALINDHIVQIGSKFKYLTVSDIQSDQVLLSWEDKTFSIKTNAPQPNKH